MRPVYLECKSFAVDAWKYQLFCSNIIPMWVFTKSLFYRLPTVLVRGQIWRIMTIEIGFQVILLLPCTHNFWLPSSSDTKSWWAWSHGLKIGSRILLIYIHTPAGSFCHLCSQVPHRSERRTWKCAQQLPNNDSVFFIFFSKLMYFFNPVFTIAHSCLLNDG